MRVATYLKRNQHWHTHTHTQTNTHIFIRIESIEGPRQTSIRTVVVAQQTTNILIMQRNRMLNARKGRTSHSSDESKRKEIVGKQAQPEKRARARAPSISTPEMRSHRKRNSLKMWKTTALRFNHHIDCIHSSRCSDQKKNDEYTTHIHTAHKHAYERTDWHRGRDVRECWAE